MKRTIPLNIKIIALLAFFSGIYMVVAWIIYGTTLWEDTNDLSDILRLMWSICFIFTVILCVLLAFIAWGLLTGKQWARIVTIIICCTGIVSFLVSFGESDWMSKIFILIIYLAIASYLLFSKKARSYFKKT